MIKRCSGCGIILQEEEPQKEGYTEDINKELCTRCFKLKNYGEYKQVSLTNQDYTDILNSIPKDALVVYLTSLLNINLNYINNFNNGSENIKKENMCQRTLNINWN